MPSLDRERALTFGTLAEQYAKWRPTYPDEAVDFLSPVAPARVADVGAGTGQLTGALLDRGLVVDAVDPDADMLRVLARTCPDAHAHVGRANALPLASASLDAVLAATNPDFTGGANSTRPEPEWPFPRGEVQTQWFPWDWHVSPEHYRNALATNSAVTALSEAERGTRLDVAEAIVRRVCDEAGSPTAPVHHEAFCLKWGV